MKIKSVSAATKVRRSDGTVAKQHYPNINPKTTGAGVTFAMNALNSLTESALLEAEVITISDAPVSITNGDAKANITFPEGSAVEFINYGDEVTIDASGGDNDPEHSKVIFTQGEKVIVNTANTPDYVCCTGDFCTITTGFGSDTIINSGNNVSINAVGVNLVENGDVTFDDFSPGTQKWIENSGQDCVIQAAADSVYIKNTNGGHTYQHIDPGNYGLIEAELASITAAGNHVTIKNSGDFQLIGTENAEITNTGYCVAIVDNHGGTIYNSGNRVYAYGSNNVVNTGDYFWYNTSNYLLFNGNFDGSKIFFNSDNVTDPLISDSRFSHTDSDTNSDTVSINSTGDHCQFAVRAASEANVVCSGSYNDVNFTGTKGNSNVTIGAGSYDTVTFHLESPESYAEINAHYTTLYLSTNNYYDNYYPKITAILNANHCDINIKTMNVLHLVSKGKFNTWKLNVGVRFEFQDGKRVNINSAHHFSPTESTRNHAPQCLIEFGSTDVIEFGDFNQDGVECPVTIKLAQYEFAPENSITVEVDAKNNYTTNPQYYAGGFISFPNTMTSFRWKYADQTTVYTFSLQE